MFSLELGSFVEADFGELKKRRLTAGAVGLDFGPFATTESAPLPKIDDLIAAAATLADCNPLKTGLRRFISELHVSRDSAGFLARRVEQIAGEKSPAELAKLKASLAKLTGRSGTLENLIVSDSARTPALDLLVLTKFVKSNQGGCRHD